MKRNTFFARLADLFYPPRCVWCHCFLSGDDRAEGVCSICRSRLPVLADEDRHQILQGIDLCTSALDYAGDVRQSILRYKFGGLSFYCDIYADLLADVLIPAEYSCDVVTWVPLSRKRLRNRGYDQARLLAEGFAGRKNLPCEKLLAKTRNTAQQSGTRSKEERMTNILGAYRPVDERKIAGKSVLLVDDIVTTGATLSECAAVLRSAGAKKVTALTLARTELERNTAGDG